MRTIQRRWFAITALLLVSLLGLLLARNSLTLTPTARRLVGSWTTPGPGGPGVTRTWTFRSDRRVTIRDDSDKSGLVVGEVTGDDDATWFVEGQTIIIRRQPTASLIDRALGKNVLWDRMPIVSLSDDVLVIGNAAYRVVLKRAATDPPQKLR